MSNLVLYELPGCPFCTKVRRKLDELDLDYESRTVPPAHHERTEVKEISGQTKVPVLVDPEHDIAGLSESNDIVRYLGETYGPAKATSSRP